MSNPINESLLERAADCITYFEGKLPAQLIEADLKSNDLEALYLHTCAAEAQMAENEFEYGDIS